MADDYPYMISNNKIKPIIDAIHDAAKPPKFSHEFLKQIGFNSSNDRAVIPLFKRLGFLSENGAPTSYYDDLKDTTKREVALFAALQNLKPLKLLRWNKSKKILKISATKITMSKITMVALLKYPYRIKQDFTTIFKFTYLQQQIFRSITLFSKVSKTT